MIGFGNIYYLILISFKSVEKSYFELMIDFAHLRTRPRFLQNYDTSHVICIVCAIYLFTIYNIPKSSFSLKSFCKFYTMSALEDLFYKYHQIFSISKPVCPKSITVENNT